MAAPAGAATFASGLNLTMTPFAGESNQVILSLTTSGPDTFWVVTRDNAGAAPVSAGSSCTQQTAAAQVRCEITGIANLLLGDGNDKVTKTANGHGAILNGEAGADTLVVLDNAAATLERRARQRLPGGGPRPPATRSAATRATISSRPAPAPT